MATGAETASDASPDMTRASASDQRTTLDARQGNDETGNQQTPQQDADPKRRH